MMELVRYIHLNPLRAGVVADYRRLNAYRYCGHGVLLGKRKIGFHMPVMAPHPHREQRFHYP